MVGKTCRFPDGNHLLTIYKRQAITAMRRGMRFSYPSGSTPLTGYTIECGIGVGGFGEVYFAISEAGKKVALKKIQRNLDIELRGVRQCINLNHVNLITLWDIRTSDDNESWVVMEYVPGPSLRDIVEAYPRGMPADQVKRWFVSIASGVAYLHQKGIVHRDLKPGNIFLDEDSHVIKIGDYGLSKFMAPSRRGGQTESVGTFHYMAPEIGRGVYGKEIDIYAMGIILFEMLTGGVPFDGESSQEIIMRHLTDTPKVDLAPPEFREAILRALHKDPELRYHTVHEMLAEMPWPDVAADSQNIVAHNSVGPLVARASNPRPKVDDSRHDKITHHHPSSQTITDQQVGNARGNGDAGSLARSGDGTAGNISTGPSRLPVPIVDASEITVVTPGIVFGPLKDESQSGNRPGETSSVGEIAGKNELIRFIDPANAGTSMSRASGTAEEPIARVIQSGFTNLGHWWTHANVSTPIKVFLLVVVSIIVVKNSEWLLRLALGLGVIYLIYYAARGWFQQSDSESTALSDKPKPPTKKELKLQSLLLIRAWIDSRPIVDRVTELLGSLLVGAFACLVLNLLGLAIGGSMLDATIESWTIYAWLTTTSIVACWLLLIVGKFWESRPGEQVLRRLAQLAIGMIVGAVAFFAAGTFNVDLSDASLFAFGSSDQSRLVIEGVPLLPAYLIFFTALFGILRWWFQVDPARSTRLSVLSVSLCLIWATLFSHVLEIPLAPNCILAVVISASSQLAAPWLSPGQRNSLSTPK